MLCRSRLLAVLWFLTSASLLPVTADEQAAAEIHGDGLKANQPQPDPTGWRTLRLADLPAPPAEVQSVLDRGKITWLVGGLRPSLVHPELSTSARKGIFAAETQFQLNYSFRSQCRWQWVQTGSPRRLQVSVRFEQLELIVEHRVWLRKMPDQEGFWDSPLVQHELDHVRLSSDPRLADQFFKAVLHHTEVDLSSEQSLPLIARAKQRNIENEQSDESILAQLSGADAQPFISSLVQSEFDRIVQLVEIRYQELDRETQHGKQPVAAGSPLSEWLRK